MCLREFRSDRTETSPNCDTPHSRQYTSGTTIQCQVIFFEIQSMPYSKKHLVWLQSVEVTNQQKVFTVYNNCNEKTCDIYPYNIFFCINNVFIYICIMQ